MINSCSTVHTYPGDYDCGFDHLKLREEIAFCEAESCNARFFLIESRTYPKLCIEHAADRDREVVGWTPENSID